MGFGQSKWTSPRQTRAAIWTATCVILGKTLNLSGSRLHVPNLGASQRFVLCVTQILTLFVLFCMSSLLWADTVSALPIGSLCHFGAYLWPASASVYQRTDIRAVGICFACTQEIRKYLGDCPLQPPLPVTDECRGIHTPAPLPLTRATLGQDFDQSSLRGEPKLSLERLVS